MAILILLLCAGGIFMLARKKIALQQEKANFDNMMKTIAWGDTSLPVTQSYPKLEDMQELLQYPTLTLETVKYQEFVDLLFGIQLVFKEGLETPLFQTGRGIDSNLSPEQMSMDLDNQITQVSVFITIN